jgi:hypothetical protein
MSHVILVFHEIMQSRFEHLDLFILPMYAQAANQVGSIFFEIVPLLSITLYSRSSDDWNMPQ